MEKLTYTRKEAAASFGVGLNQFDALLRKAEDPAPSIRVGKRVLIPVKEFREWIGRQIGTQTIS